MKKNRKRAVSIALSLVLAMTAVNITGCGKKADSTNGELNLFIWTEYVPDEVIKDFEKEYGIKVNVSTFSSNEDMLAKVKSEDEGTYDIVQPSDYMVESMIAQGMLEKLDQDALTNLSNIGSQYLAMSTLFLIRVVWQRSQSTPTRYQQILRDTQISLILH